MSTFLRRPSRRPSGRTATLVTSQSRVRICSMPRSITTTSTPSSSGSSGSSTRTRVSITWPSTSTSPGRWENLRSDTFPVISVTALGSIAVTRPMGTKILRRVSSSTTSPSTRGWWRTMLMLITTSRTRPMDSPSGPRTTIPASRAA